MGSGPSDICCTTGQKPQQSTFCPSVPCQAAEATPAAAATARAPSIYLYQCRLQWAWVSLPVPGTPQHFTHHPAPLNFGFKGGRSGIHIPEFVPMAISKRGRPWGWQRDQGPWGISETFSWPCACLRVMLQSPVVKAGIWPGTGTKRGYEDMQKVASWEAAENMARLKKWGGCTACGICEGPSGEWHKGREGWMQQILLKGAKGKGLYWHVNIY